MLWSKPHPRDSANCIVPPYSTTRVSGWPGLTALHSGAFIPFTSKQELSAYLTITFEQTGGEGARFFEGGELFCDAYARAVAAIEKLLHLPGWSSALVVAHEGINRLL
ncbi:histidine phosphatase family protein [Candidatus Phycosocius spiralis]|uniref:Uncharacterized protein n=1 Tax=Candidatus Phycosocius spiralis TaxID=2815099 RepID=A0ABQ4PTD1_9PROT|nr:hypothetical protein PsB1_0431 [Candidatus Phycosocius spiralis]